ncbi:MAG: DUF6125 family protein [Candidatus Freyarchaeota archaeon]
MEHTFSSSKRRGNGGTHGKGFGGLNVVPPEMAAEFFRSAYAGIDGVWFMCVEEKYGLEEAAELDAKVWSIFARILAKRVMKWFGVKGCDVEALVKTITLRWTMEGWEFKVPVCRSDRAVMLVRRCPWLETIRKSGREHVIPLVCGKVCEAVYQNWAQTVNPNIRLRRPRRMGEGDELCEFIYTYE